MEDSVDFTTDPIELAWAAGLFDGEGHISFRYAVSNGTTLYRRMEIQITQIDTYVLERFARAVGYGKVYGPLGDARGRRHPVYKLCIAGYPQTHETWVRLLPYLSPVKVEQGRRAFTSYRDSPVSIPLSERHLYDDNSPDAADLAARKDGVS